MYLMHSFYQKPAEMLKFVQSFPGVGPTLANSVLQSFSNMQSFVNASPEQLQTLPKVSSARADAIADCCQK